MLSLGTSFKFAFNLASTDYLLYIFLPIAYFTFPIIIKVD
jgi:hypothetical protein